MVRKVVIHRPGSYEQLRVERHAIPQPGPGEVLVEVDAAGVNYADCVVRMGLYSSARELVGWPITPGFEVAGRVGAIGAGGGEDLTIGQEVVAVTLFGGYATHVVVPRLQIRPRPEALSRVDAAGFGAVMLTAWFALHELAHPRAGATLLVHSAAGGVGGALVQLGKLAGCRVIGVVGGAHKVEAARRMGADEVIDKSSEPLWAAAERYAPGGYDVVLDANGVATLRQSYAHLAAPGKLVVYGFHTMLPRKGGRPSWPRLALSWLRTPRFDPLDMTTRNRSVLAFNLSYLFERQDILSEAMDQLLDLVKQGRLIAPPATTYPLEQVADAHRDIESGRTVGKLVLLTS